MYNLETKYLLNELPLELLQVFICNVNGKLKKNNNIYSSWKRELFKMFMNRCWLIGQRLKYELIPISVV